MHDTNDVQDTDPCIQCARSSVEHFVNTYEILSLPSDLPPWMYDERAGVFVSLHIGEDLRGCMGTIEPTQTSVAEEIVRNGVLACSEDPRFSPVRIDELDLLSYSVDVLKRPEPYQASMNLT